MSFGELIKKARAERGCSQRELAKIVGINFTYLSKLENDRADYPASEEVIGRLAIALELDKEELIQRSGKITEEDIEVLRKLFMRHKRMPELLRFFLDNPEFVEKLQEEN